MAAQNIVKHKALVTIDIRAPLAMAAAAIVVFACAATFAATRTYVESGFTVAGKVVANGKSEVIRHAKGGTVAEVRVVEGQNVEAGDVLIAFDTSAIDQQLANLKSQSKAVDTQLDVLTAEVATLMDLADRKLAHSGRLSDLQKQLASASADAARLTSEIQQSEADLEKAVARSPVTGRVVMLSASSRGAIVLPDAALAEVAPEVENVAFSMQLSPEQAAITKIGMPARIAFAVENPGSVASTRLATLVWRAAERSVDQRTGEAGYAARAELAKTGFTPLESGQSQPEKIPTHVDVTLTTGRQRLWDHLITLRSAAPEAHP